MQSNVWEYLMPKLYHIYFIYYNINVSDFESSTDGNGHDGKTISR